MVVDTCHSSKCCWWHSLCQRRLQNGSDDPVVKGNGCGYKICKLADPRKGNPSPKEQKNPSFLAGPPLHTGHKETAGPFYHPSSQALETDGTGV